MPYTESWLELEKQTGGRMVLHGSPADIRGMNDMLIQLLLPQLPPPPEGVESKDGEVNGVKYRVYHPTEAKGQLPVAIWTHGGGYMVGDLNSDDLLCRLVSLHTSSVVVNVDYRLAPEFKWPTQIEDTMTVYRWAHENAATIGGDPEKFYTVGGSAGGGLALLTASRVVADPQLKKSLKGVVALVPATTHWDNVPSEYESIFKAYTENATDVPIIDKESMDIFYTHVGADPKDPGAFVILASDKHADFPPTYFASCEYDPLRDDAYLMEAALKKAGVPTKHDHYKGLPHYFWIFPSVPEGKTFIGNLLGGVEWIKSQM